MRQYLINTINFTFTDYNRKCEFYDIEYLDNINYTHIDRNSSVMLL